MTAVYLPEDASWDDGFLQSTGSGVIDLLNPSRARATSTDLRNQQLGNAVAVINLSSDTKAVTIDIGLNELLRDPRARPRTRRSVRLLPLFAAVLRPQRERRAF